MLRGEGQPFFDGSVHVPYGSVRAPCGGKLTRLSFAAFDPSISTNMTEKVEGSTVSMTRSCM